MKTTSYKIAILIPVLFLFFIMSGCAGGGGGQGGPLAYETMNGSAQSRVNFNIRLSAPSGQAETGAIGSVEIVLFRGAYFSKYKYAVRTVYVNYLARSASFDIFQGETYSVMVNAAVKSSVYDTVENIFSGTREIFIEQSGTGAADAASQAPSFAIELDFVKQAAIFADSMDILKGLPAIVDKDKPWPDFLVAFYDVYGSVLPCVNDSVEITALNGTIDGALQVNARDGVAVFSGLSSPDTGKLRLSVKSEYFSIPEFTVYVKDPASEQIMSGIEFVTSAPALCGNALPEIVVRAFDQYGITYGNAAGPVSISIANGSLNGAAEAYFSSGYARFQGLSAAFTGSSSLTAVSGPFSAQSAAFSISRAAIVRSTAFVTSGSTLYCYDIFTGADASSAVSMKASLRWQKYFIWGLKKMKGCPRKNRLYGLSGDNYIYEISGFDSAAPRVNPINFSQVGRIVDFSTSVSDLALYIAYEATEGNTYVTKYHRANDPYFLRSITKKYANIDLVFETAYNQVITKGADYYGASVMHTIDFSQVPPVLSPQSKMIPFENFCVDRLNGAVLAFRKSSSEIYRIACDTESVSLKKETELGIGEPNSLLLLADVPAGRRLYHPSEYNNIIYCYDYYDAKKKTVVFNGSPLIKPSAVDIAAEGRALAVLGKGGVIRLVDMADHSLMGDIYLYDSAGARLENTDQMVIY
jgi:hypothetical protein